MTIIFSTFEDFLCNSYFLISFLTTIFYWIKTIFFSSKNYMNYGFIGFSILNILVMIQLAERWFESGHFPLSNLYESLLFLSWGIITIYLCIEYFLKNELIGILISPLILCILAFSGLSLPADLQQIKPLVPALQSNWLFMHVSVMILSYSALLIGSILAITYLVIYLCWGNQNSLSSLSTENITGDTKIISEVKITNLLNSTINSNPKKDQIDSFFILFDNLSYRTIGIGFCFLTLGILSGAVWANETWGTYWSWDPKETWALITWLIFAAYLHTRLLYGWQGVKPALLATLGFFIIWICYLGVNLLGKGLHTYGFLT